MNQRVWIYTLSKPLTSLQLSDFTADCNAFISAWTAHEIKLDASFELYKNRLLIFKVNESSYNASGCSIDKQTRFVKELESKFNIELLNRLLVAYEFNSEIEFVHQSKIKDLLANEVINEETFVYNNTLNNSLQLENEWNVPLKNSWLNKYLIAKI